MKKQKHLNKVKTDKGTKGRDKSDGKKESKKNFSGEHKRSEETKIIDQTIEQARKKFVSLTATLLAAPAFASGSLVCISAIFLPRSPFQTLDTE